MSLVQLFIFGSMWGNTAKATTIRRCVAVDLGNGFFSLSLGIPIVLTIAVKALQVLAVYLASYLLECLEL